MPADTPQHSIRDGEHRIIYVTGNRGLYKMFPDTGQILMFKEAGVGNQGHMAGYAGYGGPPKGIMELLITDYSVSANPTAPVGARHVPNIGWVDFGQSSSVAPGVSRWTSISANKFNPDELLVLAHGAWGLNVSEGRIEGSGPTCQVYGDIEPANHYAKIWYSDDGGDTFSPFLNITLNMPASIAPISSSPFVRFRAHKIQWDHIVDGRWAMIGTFTHMYHETAYDHEAKGMMLVVGDRSGNAHMWLRPTPNVLPDGSVWGPPNWPNFGHYGLAWSWVDPDPDTGFHKIVIGTTLTAGAYYQHVLAETSIPGPTGTSWQPAYTVNKDAEGRMTTGLAVFGFDPLDHRRGTFEVYQAMRNAQNTQGVNTSIGGQMLWQVNYMEPTPGFNGNHWDFFIPGVELGGDVVAAADALYIANRYGGTQGPGGILRFPYGSTLYEQHTVVPGTEGRTVGSISVDEQHKVYIACNTDNYAHGISDFFVFDGETWGYIEAYRAQGGTGGYMSVGSFAIINRTPL